MFTRLLLPILAAVLLVLAVRHVIQAQKIEPPLPPPAAPPRTPYDRTVAGTGVVEPQTENISIGALVSGVVVEVFVKVNQTVRAGDPLFRIDDRELRATLKLRQADLLYAEAQLTRLKKLPRDEDRPVSRAKVDEAESNLKDKLYMYRSGENQVKIKSITDEEFSNRESNYLMAKAQLDQAKAQLELLEAGSWTYDLQVAQQAVEQARAQVDQVVTDLERLTTRALVDGEVLQVNVRPGEYVGTSPGQAFIMLGNVQQLHVRVSIDEYDIPRYRVGAKARAQLKGQSDVEYPLSFVRVEPFVVPKKSLTGENTERVDTRVLQIIYSVDSQPARLYVGQQLDVFIDGNEPALRESSGPPNAGTVKTTTNLKHP